MENWYFTFGCGTKLANKYAKFSGTFEEARAKMIEYYGLAWCAQESEENIKPMAEKYGWTEIEDNEKTAFNYRVYNELYRVLTDTVSSSYAEKLADKIYKKVAADIKETTKNLGRKAWLEFTTIEIKYSLGKVLCEIA